MTTITAETPINEMLASLLSAAVDVLREKVEDLGPMGKIASDGLTAHLEGKSPVKAVAHGLLNSVDTKIKAILGIALAFALLLGPVALVLAIVAGIIAGLIALIHKISG